MDLEMLLSAAGGATEPADDFVEDEQDVMLESCGA